MALTDDIRDRELKKFRPGTGSDSTVAVTIEGDSGLLQGLVYDEIIATYPTSTTENYNYKLSGVSVANILITYTDATKANLSSAKRV